MFLFWSPFFVFSKDSFSPTGKASNIRRECRQMLLSSVIRSELKIKFSCLTDKLSPSHPNSWLNTVVNGMRDFCSLSETLREEERKQSERVISNGEHSRKHGSETRVLLCVVWIEVKSMFCRKSWKGLRESACTSMHSVRRHTEDQFIHSVLLIKWGKAGVERSFNHHALTLTSWKKKEQISFPFFFVAVVVDVDVVVSVGEDNSHSFRFCTFYVSDCVLIAESSTRTHFLFSPLYSFSSRFESQMKQNRCRCMRAENETADDVDSVSFDLKITSKCGRM